MASIAAADEGVNYVVGPRSTQRTRRRQREDHAAARGSAAVGSRAVEHAIFVDNQRSLGLDAVGVADRPEAIKQGVTPRPASLGRRRHFVDRALVYAAAIGCAVERPVLTEGHAPNG